MGFFAKLFGRDRSLKTQPTDCWPSGHAPDGAPSPQDVKAGPAGAATTADPETPTTSTAPLDHPGHADDSKNPQN